jgi:hypothetical protein
MNYYCSCQEKSMRKVAKNRVQLQYCTVCQGCLVCKWRFRFRFAVFADGAFVAFCCIMNVSLRFGLALFSHAHFTQLLVSVVVFLHSFSRVVLHQLNSVWSVSHLFDLQSRCILCAFLIDFPLRRSVVSSFGSISVRIINCCSMLSQVCLYLFFHYLFWLVLFIVFYYFGSVFVCMVRLLVLCICTLNFFPLICQICSVYLQLLTSLFNTHTYAHVCLFSVHLEPALLGITGDAVSACDLSKFPPIFRKVRWVFLILLSWHDVWLLCWLLFVKL